MHLNLIFAELGGKRPNIFQKKDANFDHSVLHAVQLMRDKVESWIEVFELSNLAQKFKLFKDSLLYHRSRSLERSCSSFNLAVTYQFFKGLTCNLWTMEAVEAVSSRTFGTLLLNCLAALSAMTSEAARRREWNQLVNWLQNFEIFDQSFVLN